MEGTEERKKNRAKLRNKGVEESKPKECTKKRKESVKNTLPVPEDHVDTTVLKHIELHHFNMWGFQAEESSLRGHDWDGFENIL